MLAPVRTVAPAETPISLAEAKAHLRVDHADDDARIEAMIKSATADLDGWSGILGRAIVSQTWTQAFAGFCDRLRLPLGPVSSITSVTYFDGDNVSQTLSTDVYRLLTDARGAFVARKPDQDWPSTYGREDAVTVTFVAGYGAAAAVPENLKSAIKLAVEMEYDAPDESRAKALMAAYDRIVAKYRRVGF